MVAALAYLTYLNREHARIQETLIAALFGMLGVVFSVIFFVSKSREMDKDIASVFLLSLEQKKPVFPTAPVLSDYFFHQSIVWGDFERVHSMEAKNAMESLPQSVDSLATLTDLQSIALMHYLGQLYQTDWDIIHTRKVLPGSSSFRGMGLNPDPGDKRVFSSEGLDRAFKGNRFHESLRQIHQVTFPKGTNLTYIPYSKQNRKCQISLSKRYAFEISITLCFSAYSAGLGKVANYIGTTVPTNVWSVNWKDRDSFGMAEVDIDCHAEFYPLKSGNPGLQRYRKWIESLFDNLHADFDWSLCDQRVRDYSAELAHLKTINDLGRGFEQK